MPLLPVVTVFDPFTAVPPAVPCVAPNPVSVPPFSVSLQVTLRSGFAPQLAAIVELVSVMLPTEL